MRLQNLINLESLSAQKANNSLFRKRNVHVLEFESKKCYHPQNQLNLKTEILVSMKLKLVESETFILI